MEHNFTFSNCILKQNNLVKPGIKKIALALTLIVITVFSSNLRAQYVVNGSAASLGGGCYRLTPDVGGQGGFVWYQNFMSLNSDFDMTFQVYLGSKDASGADGIAFVMQPNNTGAGSTGGGLGYQGISPSITVEYDTWQNQDPAYDHIAVQRNGDVNTFNAVAGPVQASSTSQNIEDGQWHTTHLTWDATTKTLTVYFDGVFRLSYTSDIVNNTFSGNPNVFWGFTGSTGAASNLQQFCVTNTVFQQALTVTTTKTDLTCNGGNNGTATASASGGIAPYTFTGWYQGATLISMNPSVSGLAAGTYTAHYTDSANATSTGTVTINSAIPPSTNACTYMYISNVSTSGCLTDFTNPSGCSPISYTDYSATKTATQVQSGTVNLHFSSYGYILNYSVWVDFDDNGAFSPTEQVMAHYSSSLNESAAFMIPALAPLGTHIMRVRAEYFNFNAPSNPCGGLVYGETEDYSLTVTPACTNCIPPNPESITTSSNPACIGQGTTLTCIGAVGTVYWYTGSCGGTQIGTGNTINVAPITTTTYYARNNNGGHFSNECTSITITPCACPEN